MPKRYHLPSNSPIHFFSPVEKHDLSTLALVMAGAQTPRAMEEISDVADIFIALKRNPAAGQTDLALQLGISQATVSRRMEILRALMQEDIVVR
jgi:hypothetical protein